MRTPFSRLEERVFWFGNHHRKYLHFIKAKQTLLIDRLEEKGLVEQVHLWTAASDRFAKEIHLIESVGRTRREKLDFIGWFYSTQFLLMNIRAIDVLSLNLTLGQDRYKEYRQFMKQIGWEFRNLTAVYMESALNLIIPKKDQPEFAILSVGTRADQDDIDLGIIDDGSEKRQSFSHAIWLLQSEMLKHASRLHLYLSEYIGSQFYSASITEYNTLLSKEIQDFVVISEMLSAALILGSKRLFYEFQQTITSRYFFYNKKSNRYHEGFLRGILGEVRSLLARKIREDRIHPKMDALRIIKGMVYAGKTICGIRQVNAWDILDLLSLHQPGRKAEYQTYDKVLSFFEIFRFLYQLFIVQEEEIIIQEDQDIARLELVAEVMGYQKQGTKKASDFLLMHYYENLELTKRVTETLLNDFTQHLKVHTVFNTTFQQIENSETDPKQHLLLFFQTARFFRSIIFWDDIFEILAENDGKLLKQLVNSLLSEESEKIKLYSRMFVHGAKNSFYSYFKLLVLLASYRHESGFKKIFDAVNDEFLRVVSEERDRAWRIARLYNYDPRLLNSYIMALNEDKQKQFIGALEVGSMYTREDSIVKDKLKNLGELYFKNSRYFRRYFLTVIHKYPKFIEYIDDSEQLRKFAKGFLGSIENYTSFQIKKEKLSDSFYIDFFRVGLATINGQKLDFVESEYVTFSLNYLRELFNICKTEIETELGRQLMTRDLLAIFIAGSLGREQAFDDDFDLIVLLNSDDAELRVACSKVINRMNREIIRQAVMPHYRFVEHFGYYVTLLSELEDFLAQPDQNCYIEKSQLLGAHMVVGSSRFERIFVRRIINPFIFKHPAGYIEAMIQECHERHQMIEKIPTLELSVKECRGGLRDIETILLIYKTFYHLDEPVNRKLMDTLGNKVPEFKEHMQQLGQAYDFLKRIRNIYRLAVAAKNSMDPEFLDRPAEIMGIAADASNTAAQIFVNQFYEICKNSWRIIERLINHIQMQLTN